MHSFMALGKWAGPMAFAYHLTVRGVQTNVLIRLASVFFCWCVASWLSFLTRNCHAFDHANETTSLGPVEVVEWSRKQQPSTVPVSISRRARAIYYPAPVVCACVCARVMAGLIYFTPCFVSVALFPLARSLLVQGGPFCCFC